MFFYMNYYWIKSHLMGISFIILNKFILPTMFSPFEPDLEKGYQDRCLWDSNISLIYTVISIHYQGTSISFTKLKSQPQYSITVIKITTGPLN